MKLGVRICRRCQGKIEEADFKANPDGYCCDFCRNPNQKQDSFSEVRFQGNNRHHTTRDSQQRQQGLAEARKVFGT